MFVTTNAQFTFFFQTKIDLVYAMFELKIYTCVCECGWNERGVKAVVSYYPCVDVRSCWIAHKIACDLKRLIEKVTYTMMA